MSLSLVEAVALFGRMLDGELADDEIRDVLVELADRGESPNRIIAVQHEFPTFGRALTPLASMAW